MNVPEPDERVYKEYDTWSSYADERAKYMGEKLYEKRYEELAIPRALIDETRSALVDETSLTGLRDTLKEAPTTAKMAVEMAIEAGIRERKEKLSKALTEIARWKIRIRGRRAAGDGGVQDMLGEENEAKRDRLCDLYGKGLEYEYF